MTTLTQLFTVAEHGRGDCWRTVIACLLDKASPEEVPDFLYHADGSENDDWFVDTWNWLGDNGYKFDWHELNEESPAPDFPYMLSGLSPRKHPDGSDIYHVVVAQGQQILHDPHPERKGLVSHKIAFIILPAN